MKKILSLLLLVAALAAGSLSAQEFSGTITWSLRVELSDPTLKAAQDAMGSMGGGLFPKGFILQLKGPRALVKTDGGLTPTEVLTLADKNLSYQIDRKAGTYQKLSADPLKDAVGNYKVTPTTETARILGYTCRRYRVETVGSDEKMTYVVWATNEIKGLDARTLRRLQFGKTAGSGFLRQIEGVPLRIDGVTPDAKLQILATGVKPEVLPGAIFVLPPGFKETAGQGL
jgi:hypothetical protein